MSIQTDSPAPTPGYGLSEQQEGRLLALLKRLEAADHPSKALWLDSDSRNELAAIRQKITGDTQ